MLVSAHGFTELLERMTQVRDIARQNAQVTLVVEEQRVSMAAAVAQADHIQLLGSPL